MEAITRLTRNLHILHLQRLQSKMWYEKHNFYLTTKKISAWSHDYYFFSIVMTFLLQC